LGVKLIDFTPEKLLRIALPSTGRTWPEKGQKRHKRRTPMLARHMAPKVNFGNPFEKFCVIARETERDQDGTPS